MAKKKPKSLKLLFIVGSFPPIVCGVGDYTCNLVDELKKKSHKVSIITSRKAKKSRDVYPIISTWRVNEFQKIFNFIRKIKPDAVVIQYPTNEYSRYLLVNFLPLMIKKTFNIPVIFVAHEYSEASGLAKIKLRLTLDYADNIIFTNINDYKQFKKIFPKKNIFHLPIASNIPVVNKSLKRMDDQLVFFGLLEESKGLETLMRSLELLSSRVRLTIAGAAKDKKYIKSLKTLAKEIGVINRIDWEENKNKKYLSSVLSKSTLCVLPFDKGISERRGSFFAAVEHGVPVISTRSVKTKGFFRNMKNIVLVPPKDSKKLADGIKLLLRSKKLRKTISSNASSDWSEFNFKQIGNRYEEIISSLVLK